MMKLSGQGMTECDDLPDCQNIIHINGFRQTCSVRCPIWGRAHNVLAHIMGWECHVHSVQYSMLWLLVLSHSVHDITTFP